MLADLLAWLAGLFGFTGVRALLQLRRAELDLVAGDPDTAARRIRAVLEAGTNPRLDLAGRLVLARCEVARQDDAAVREVLDTAMQRIRQTDEAELGATLAFVSDLGTLYHQIGDVPAATEAWELCERLARSAGNPEAEAFALTNLATVAAMQGAPARAAALRSRAIAIFREIGDQHALQSSLANLASDHQLARDLDKARAAYDECVALAEQLGEPQRAAMAMGNWASVLANTGDLDGAERLYAESRRLREEAGDDDFAVLDGNLGWLAYTRGDLEGALAHIDRSLAAHDGKRPHYEGLARCSRGRVLRLLGRADEARADVLAGLELLRSASSRQQEGVWLRELGEQQRLAGDSEAVSTFDAAIRLLERAGDRKMTRATQLQKALCPGADVTEARVDAAIDDLREEGDLLELVQGLARCALHRRSNGRDAAAILDEARGIADRLGLGERSEARQLLSAAS
ncbi:MAG: tetratricopeptide repeat protein [Alphaproteobacteria bacterium]|nr:tetratricopeptide repeat protein [Alphaproteobacteria bacterium]